MEEEKQPKAKLSNGQTAEELTARLPIPGPGRPKETEIDKVRKKAIKELVEEYKERLADILPLIDPVLAKKVQEGDMAAIKEINDVIVEKAVRKTDLTSDGEKIQPVLVKFLDAKETDNSRNTE